MEEEDGGSSIFSELKHYNIELLQLHQNPKNNPSALTQLLQLLQRSSSDSLQPFFDYTLFPLLLLLDAAVDSRSSTKVDSDERLMMPNTLSDIVMEGALHCLEELLKKCCIGSVDQIMQWHTIFQIFSIEIPTLKQFHDAKASFSVLSISQLIPKYY